MTSTASSPAVVPLAIAVNDDVAAVKAIRRERRIAPDEQAEENRRRAVRAWLAKATAPLLGLALFVLIWQLIAQTGGQLPTPASTWDAAKVLFADPFYRKA